MVGLADLAASRIGVWASCGFPSTATLAASGDVRGSGTGKHGLWKLFSHGMRRGNCWSECFT